MEDFEVELKIGFLQEASQLLQETERCFLTLESNPSDDGLLDQIFRLTHNLKGSSRAVGFEAMGAFTHEFESLLLKIKSGEVERSTAAVNLLLRCNDHLRMMVEALTQDLGAKLDSNALTLEVNQARQGIFAVANSPASKPKAAKATGVEQSIRVNLIRLEKLQKFIDEMVVLQNVLREQSSTLESHPLRETVRQLGKISQEIQDISVSLCRVPLRATFQKIRRIVRDTGQILAKKVALSVSGEETELDKTVLEHLGDPLVHIIRNAVDHGIESVEKRRASGKPEAGQIGLSAFREGEHLVIEVKDDGGGMDANALVAKAIEKGILSPGQTLPEHEALQLIFYPGFSTKTEVTEISGRGIGMDVVKTNIEKLSGEVRISTQIGQGTTFRIFLPLTLATIDRMKKPKPVRRLTAVDRPSPVETAPRALPQRKKRKAA
jgi:two-component system chemotaxis sensor kinase CheA